MAWNAISTIGLPAPAEVRTALSEAAMRIVAQHLHAQIASQDLFDRFDDKQIPLLFLKGQTLGALAYANPVLKSAIDIDLLIDPADLGRAANVLRDCGFELVAPTASPDDATLIEWHRDWKESVWASTSPPLQIDLHTRTADHPRLIAAIGAHSPRQWIELGGQVRLPTLARDELFAYLAVHGASSAWFRLKWIADFAGFLGNCGAAELNRLYARSQQLGAGRAAGQALLLADDLFNSLDANVRLRDQLRGDRAIGALERAALRYLTAEPHEPTERRFGTLGIHRTQLSLLPGIGFKFSELKRQVKQKLGGRR